MITDVPRLKCSPFTMSLLLTETQIVAKLRSKLAAGVDIETAVKQLHHDDGLGILLLFRPFMIVCELKAVEAKRRLCRIIQYEGCDE